jgi:hypothetical protein
MRAEVQSAVDTLIPDSIGNSLVHDPTASVGDPVLNTVENPRRCALASTHEKILAKSDGDDLDT